MTDMIPKNPRFRMKPWVYGALRWYRANSSKYQALGLLPKKMFGEDPIKSNRITNAHQLIGQYLMLKGPDTEDNMVTIRETNQKFWHYLELKGISAHRSAIVLAVSEKVATFFPGFNDANATEYDDEED
jgi:hypothetical protein